jgi:hypothetical protein
VLPHVAEAGGGEQGVADRVQRGVAVAVPRESGRARPVEIGQAQRPRIVDGERVDVGGDAGADLRPLGA